MHPDLHSVREAIRRGETSASEQAESCMAIAASPACDAVFLQTSFDAARAAARDPANARRPLAGLCVSIKDLFDIEGEPTPAGSRVLEQAPAATADCVAVERLRAAGAAIIGRTNMVEFAYSGVGTNPHHGTPRNPADAKVARVPGGSSSGAAVSVATGAAFIGLGSDTGGSIRTPAALCGIVGFKNTARLVPTTGALPLSTTLDTVCAMTRSVRDAIVAHEVLAARSVPRDPKPLSGYRLAVAQTSMLDELDATVAKAFDRALAALSGAGARIETIPLESIRDLGAIQSAGGFAAAESYAWHMELLTRSGARYDPRVRLRIERGAAITAADYEVLTQARRTWIAKVEVDLANFDAVLSPTTPIVAPPIADVAPADGRDPAQDAARDAEFFRVNALLLRNTSVVNMLDGCAISLPCHVPGELPVGLMLWHGAMHDDAILNLALHIESALAARN